MSEEDNTKATTKDEDYRWRGLSTMMVLSYGLGFPLWAMGSTIFDYAIGLDGTLMGVLVLVWMACFIYAIGPENLKTAKELRGK